MLHIRASGAAAQSILETRGASENYSTGVSIAVGNARAVRFSEHASNATYGGYSWEIGSADAGGTEIMRLTSQGNLGIGTTAPYQTLHVEGNISAQNELNFDMTTNATAYGYINWDGYQGGATQFRSLWIGNGKRGTNPIAFFDGPNSSVGVGLSLIHI